MKTKKLHQRGISLFVVMVMVLLATLLALWASRTSLFNEMVTGNDSDYQRTFEAAQAMVRDAEFDIMGRNSKGEVCIDDGYEGHRTIASGIFFPSGQGEGHILTEYQDLEENLITKTPSCVNGLCISDHLTPSFWTNKTTLAAMTANGVSATYGQFTGAKATASSNPLLIKESGKPIQAWYWVEILLNASNKTEGGITAKMDEKYPFIFRITSVAQGLKPGSQAVVQTIFLPGKHDIALPPLTTISCRTP